MGKHRYVFFFLSFIYRISYKTKILDHCIIQSSKLESAELMHKEEILNPDLFFSFFAKFVNYFSL